jgi:Tfp pilus assembly protein PilF
MVLPSKICSKCGKKQPGCTDVFGPLCHCPYKSDDKKYQQTKQNSTRQRYSDSDDSDSDSDSSSSSENEYDKADKNFSLGYLYLQSGKYGAACKKFKKAYRHCRYSDRARYKLKLDEAKQFKEQNRKSKTNFNLGMSYYNSNQFEMALTYFDQAYNGCSLAYRKKNEYYEWRQRADTKIQDAKNSRAELIFNEGMIYFNRADYNSAQRKYKEALKTCSYSYWNRSKFEQY